MPEQFNLHVQAFRGGRAAQPAATHPKVLLIGDSLTIGTSQGGSRPHTPYGRTLSENMPNNLVIVNAVSGITAQEFAEPGKEISRPWGSGERIESLLDRLSFTSEDVAVIMLGTNDLFSRYQSQQILNDLKHIHSLFFAKGMKTVAMGIPPTASWTNPRWTNPPINSDLKQWCASQECTYFDTEFVRSGLLRDGVHLNPSMSQTIGQLVAPIVKGLLH